MSSPRDALEQTSGPAGLHVVVMGLNYAPEISGIAPYTSELASDLAARGHDVRVLTTFPHYPEWRFSDGSRALTGTESVRGVTVRRLRHYVPSRPRGFLRALSELSYGVRLVLSRWGAVDVVVLPSPTLISTAMVLVRARASRRRPAIGIIVQDFYSVGHGEMGGSRVVASVLGRIERWTLCRADGVVAIHDRFKERMVRDLSVAPDSVRVIRNWTHVEERADPHARDAVRSEMGWRADEAIVLHTGAMGDKQALSNVVATAKVADAEAADVRFVLMGNGGQRSRLERESVGVSRIDIVDPVPGERYHHVLAAADVLLVNEAAGLNEMAVPSKLTSYFTSGRPVVAATGAASTTAGELVASGAGVRVEPGDPRALLSAVTTLFEDPVGAAELGARGQQYCATALAAKTCLDEYESWIKDLARARRDGG